MIMAHDAASGYLETWQPIKGEVYGWTKTQNIPTENDMGSLLECGVRAMDWRPSVVSGEIVGHHGDIDVDHKFTDSLDEMRNWLKSNTDEFVMLNIVDCKSDESGDCSSIVRDLLKSEGIPTIDNCDDLSTMTVGDIKTRGKLAEGGAMVAVFASSGSGGTGCTTQNYQEEIACWGDVNPFGVTTNTDGDNGATSMIMRKLNDLLSPYEDIISCIDGKGIDSNKQYSELQAFEQELVQACISEYGDISNKGVLADNLKGLFSYSCHDDSSSKSTPWGQMNTYLEKVTTAGKTSAPLWQTQALWQETTASVVIGTLNLSSLLEDEEKSKINSILAGNIKGGLYKNVNLFEVNNACDGGGAELMDAINSFNDKTAAALV